MQKKDITLILCLVDRIIRRNSLTGVEPLGLMAIGEYMVSLGYDVTVFAGTIFEAFEMISDNSDGKTVVGLYCDYSNQNVVKSLSCQLKRKLACYVFIGGPQTVGMGREDLLESRADALFRGEGEYQMEQALGYIAAGTPELISRIPGACTLNGSEFVDQGVYPAIRDLDDLPPITGRLTSRKGGTSMALLSGRGCPFDCSFCYEGANSRTVRWRSISHTMREIRSRLESNPDIRYIFFGDDTFTLDIPRLQEFCREMNKLRQEYDVVWFCDGHVNVIKKHPEIVSMLVDAGMVRMQIGIESCCQHIIDAYNKRIRREDLYEVVDICKKAGLKQLVGNIIIGGAFETRDTLKETFETVYDLIRRSGGMLDVSSTFYSDFPGTAMHREPDRFGLRIVDSKSDTSNEDWSIVETPSLTREEITTERIRFTLASIKLMRSMAENGEVSDAAIRDSYFLTYYGLNSLWHSFVYAGMLVLDGQNKSISMGNKPFAELADISEARPLRVLPLSIAADFSGGSMKIADYEFTPAEAEVYVLCAGKLTTNEVADELFRRYPDKYKNADAAKSELKEMFARFSEKKLLVFAGELTNMEIQAPKTDIPVPERRKVLLFKTKMMYFYGKNEQEPLSSQGIYCLASWLCQKGYDAYACECMSDEVAGLINASGMDDLLAVGFSLDFENRIEGESLIKALRKVSDIFIIAGGEESLSLAEDFLRSTGADAVITGEGELALAASLDALRNGRQLDGIKGLRFIDKDGRYMDNGKGDVVMDLDSLPFPDYGRSLRPFRPKSPTVITSRGCPYRCTFCHEGSLSQPQRKRSVKSVMLELEDLLSKYPDLSYLCFCDDSFVTDIKWVKSFCQEMAIIRERWPRVTFFCEADVPALYKHPEIFAMLVEAGLQCMQIGIESASQEMLDIYRKPITPEMVKSVVRSAKQTGVPEMVGCLLVGGPFESRKHIEKNKEYIRELMTIGAGMLNVIPSIFTPYPQTDIGRDPEKFGLTVTDSRGISSSGDYSLSHSSELDEKQILAEYHEFILVAYKAAAELALEMPHTELLDCFRKTRKENHWQKAIGKDHPQLATYYGVLARGAAERVCDVPDDELDGWRPVRMVEIWRQVDFTAGFPRLGELVLSPLEFEVLAHSSGKLTVGEVISRLWPQFGERRGIIREEFAVTVKKILLSYDSRFQLVVTPY